MTSFCFPNNFLFRLLLLKVTLFSRKNIEFILFGGKSHRFLKVRERLIYSFIVQILTICSPILYISDYKKYIVNIALFFKSEGHKLKKRNISLTLDDGLKHDLHFFCWTHQCYFHALKFPKVIFTIYSTLEIGKKYCKQAKMCTTWYFFTIFF